MLAISLHLFRVSVVGFVVGLFGAEQVSPVRVGWQIQSSSSGSQIQSVPSDWHQGPTVGSGVSMPLGHLVWVPLGTGPNILEVKTESGVFSAHVERHWLKSGFPANMPLMSVTEDTSHVSIG